jgi:hypothetical protein
MYPGAFPIMKKLSTVVFVISAARLPKTSTHESVSNICLHLLHKVNTEQVKIIE